MALSGLEVAESTEGVGEIYAEIAEHLLTAGHATSLSEIDLILSGMTVESAERILEAHKDVESGEKVDPEGYMVLRQLSTADTAIKRIKTYIGGDADLQMPAWVQAKLTSASEALDTVADYLVSDTPVMQDEKPKK